MALTGDFRVATVKFIRGYDKDKEYDFALYDYFIIKENDYVLCFTSYGYDVGKITRIVSQKEYGKPVTKEIICKCDITAYETRKDIRKRMEQLRTKLNKAVKENQNMALYKAIAKDNSEVANLLSEYEKLLDLKF